MRTYIKIDTFNLYYRALKGTRFEWLDLGKLFRRVLQPKHPGSRHRLPCHCRAPDQEGRIRPHTARTGAVTLIQRFGSALNLNIHFPCCSWMASMSMASAAPHAFAG
jgi:hypothetical protein